MAILTQSHVVHAKQKEKEKEKAPQRGLGVAKLEKIRLESTHPERGLIPVIDLEDVGSPTSCEGDGGGLAWRMAKLATVQVNKMPSPSTGVGIQNENQIPLNFNQRSRMKYSMPPSWPERKRNLESMVGMTYQRSGYIDRQSLHASTSNEIQSFNNVLVKRNSLPLRGNSVRKDALKNMHIRDDDLSFISNLHRDKRMKGIDMNLYEEDPSLNYLYLPPSSANQQHSRCYNFDHLLFDSFYTPSTVKTPHFVGVPPSHLCGFPEFNPVLNHGTSKEEILQFGSHQAKAFDSLMRVESDVSKTSDGLDLELKL